MFSRSSGRRPRLGRAAGLAFAAALLIGGTVAVTSAAAGAHGANTSGPYDSTRDGSPSGNGNGGGVASGKPCAGCVGKADGKNPPGQLPGGSDGNAGYECDRNHGVGRSNPAHTSCRTTTPTPTPTSTPTGPPTGPPSTTPASTATGSGARPLQPGEQVPAQNTAQQGALASTGVPVLILVASALVALVGGTGLAYAGRIRRRRTGAA